MHVTLPLIPAGPNSLGAISPNMDISTFCEKVREERQKTIRENKNLIKLKLKVQVRESDTDVNFNFYKRLKVLLLEMNCVADHGNQSVIFSLSNGFGIGIVQLKQHGIVTVNVFQSY